MARWFKEPKHTIRYGKFVFKYDTAYELGEMVFESGCKMPNPYEPIHLEYDEYFDGYASKRDELESQ